MGVSMRLLEVSDVHSTSVASLRLDPMASDLTTIEAVACALRRAAGFICPCSGASLIRSVIEPLHYLADNLTEVRSLVEDTLDALVAHGDLIEARATKPEGGEGVLLLYAAPPKFIRRQSGGAIIVGVAPDDVSFLSDELVARVEYVNHVRRIKAGRDEDLTGLLSQLGVTELPSAIWLKAPAAETAEQLVQSANAMLKTAGHSGEVPGLSLLNPSAPVTYYRGRWAAPSSQTGQFVARRKQAYGADLWCYVDIKGGVPQRFVDLPFRQTQWRGCDAAWHLQAAIDAVRLQPQVFRIVPATSETTIAEFFSPVPGWARRRWDTVGEPVPRKGCLFAYRFPNTELDEERTFAKQRLWLTERR